MDVLRLVLFLGLIAHKLLWELLKRRSPDAIGSPEGRTEGHVRVIKAFKACVLVFLVVQTLFLDVLPMFEDATYVKTVGFAIFVTGLTTAMVARLQLGNNWTDFEEGQILPNHRLVHTGIYKYIRHPIYTGDVLLLLGLQLALNSWLVLAVLVLAPIVVRQAIREEYALTRAIRGYEDYRRHTRRFIPFVF